MKSLLILFFLLGNLSWCMAQDENSYMQTDRIALSIPASQTDNTAALGAFIKSHFDTDAEKVRAIYTWVTSNIRYDADSLHRAILDEDKDVLITSALKRKRGVCENFASIFTDICNKSGVASFVIEGYTGQNGSVDKSTHAWCAALVNNKWFLYDPTWDIGFAFHSFAGNVKANFFQVDPAEFIQMHMPFDPMFQLLNYPVSYERFNNGNTGRNSNIPYFNFDDSIRQYQTLDPLNRYLSTLSRIRKNGEANAKINTKISELKMKIEIIYQDKDSELYNDAISDYNKAVNRFNDFLSYRNSNFSPLKSASEIQGIFNDVDNYIISANRGLEKVNKSNANLSLNTGDVEFALSKLSERVKEQQIFLKNYQDTAKEK
jgi:Transglutaminase-like superfamily